MDCVLSFLSMFSIFLVFFCVFIVFICLYFFKILINYGLPFFNKKILLFLNIVLENSFIKNNYLNLIYFSTFTNYFLNVLLIS